MSSPKFGMSELQVNLSAKDVRVTEIRSPFPLFVLDWLNNSDELEAMEIRLSDFYHEGRFSTVLANFKFDDMAKFLHWYESPKTQEVVAVLREMTKQKRLDIEILTARKGETVEEKPSIENGLGSNVQANSEIDRPAPAVPQTIPSPSPEELPKVRPLVAEEQQQTKEQTNVQEETVEHAAAFTQRYF